MIHQQVLLCLLINQHLAAFLSFSFEKPCTDCKSVSWSDKSYYVNELDYFLCTDEENIGIKAVICY